MSSIRSFARRAAVLALVPALLAIPGCAKNSDGSVTITTPAGNFTLSAAAVSVIQGATNTTTITITRTNGLTANINLTVEGAPTGLTATISPASTTGSTATLSLTATASLLVSSYALTIRGTSSGLSDQLAALTVTVSTSSAGGNFTLSGASASLAQGATGSATVNVTRTNNFAGSVTFTATNVPAGLTVSFNPTSTTTNSTLVTLTATASLTATTYNVVIHGSATGLAEQTSILAVTITATGGSGVAVAFDYSACLATQKPIWMAYQDGAGAWTRVTPTADVYRFTITASRGGVAIVTQPGATTTTVQVTYQSATEVAAAVAIPGNSVQCSATPTKSYTGTVAGLALTDQALIGLGGSSTTVLAPSTSFSLMLVPAGTFDLVAYRHSLTTPGVGDRGMIVRDVNSPTGAVLSVIDFNGGASFAAVGATFSLTGGLSGDTFLSSINYYAGAGCSAAGLSTTSPTTQSFLVNGVPTPAQRATDFHGAQLNASNPANSTRVALEWFHTIGNRSIAVPPDLAAPAMSILAGPYKILSATYNTAGYNGASVLSYSSASGNVAGTVSLSMGLSTPAVTLAFPDLSAAQGWLSAWMPAAGAAANWAVITTGSTSGGSFGSVACTEGGRFIEAIRQGVL